MINQFSDWRCLLNKIPAYFMKTHNLIWQSLELSAWACVVCENRDTNWFEPARDFITSLSRAYYTLSEGNLASQKEFLQKIGSNFILKSPDQITIYNNDILKIKDIS